MRYSKVHIEAFGYELPPVVVTSADLEARLERLYRKYNLPEGQLRVLTGIEERRWWEEGYSVSEGAIAAGRKALAQSAVEPEDVGCLIYAGVCRENFEPATACKVAAGLGINPDAAVYDLTNACLGVMNGITDMANRIELGQIRAGLIVSCESAREIIDITIAQLNDNPSMEMFRRSLATLTGGSGAAAVLLSDGSFTRSPYRRLVGGVTRAAPEFHSLCRWGLERILPASLASQFTQFMSTDSISVLKYGVELGLRTWRTFLERLGWARDQIDKVICHQVGTCHRDSILKAIGIPPEKDYSTFEYLGNIGTVSLPLTAALADERGFLNRGDRVGFLGIGSGLNCLMLGWEW
jgi:3-oxoacyl-[acyl-carrier-protein] synthase III